MTDALIKTDGTTAGLSAGAPIADTDVIEIQQTTVAPASTVYEPFSAIKTWIKSWIAASDVGLGYGSPRNRFYAYTDCTQAGGSTFTDHWATGYSGTGSQPFTVSSLAGTLGVISLGLGTTTTGRASWTGGASLHSILMGQGQARFQSKFAIHVLSDGTNTYTTRLGFIDSLTGESTDGCFFRYTDGVNGGKWQAVCRSNNTETAVDTGVTPVADAFQRFEIIVNAAGTSVSFFIDGVQVGGAVTTNIPTGASRVTGYGAMGLKSAGTTSTSAGYIDYMEVEVLFTSAR